MRPSALGAKSALFLTLVIAAFVASPYTNLFFLLLSFLVVVLALGTLWTWTNLGGVSGRIAAARPFPAARPAAASIELIPGRRIHWSLEVVVRLDGERRSRVIARCPTLDGNGARVVPGEFPALPRGIHPVRSAFVRSKHPFGLWWRSVRVEAPAQLIVHPRALDDISHRSASELGADMHSALGSPSTDCVAGLRDWTVGDSLHVIDWRATARRARPIVKEFDQQSGRGITVNFDRRCEIETFERCLSALVMLCRHARETDQPLQLTTQGMRAAFGGGQRSPDELLRWLAAAQPMPRGAEPLPPSAPDTIRLPSAGPVTARGPA